MMTSKECISRKHQRKVPHSATQERRLPFFQPKLQVGPTNDVYEREADAVAEKVMRMPDSAGTAPLSIVQRTCEACEKEERRAQREATADAQTGEAPEVVHEALRSPGNSLDGGTRSFMESRLGYDFSHVKIHTGAVAAKSAQSIQARAFTSGSDIVFNEGAYSPGTADGKRLLAHELTHVVQQGGNVMKKKDDRIFRNVLPPPPVPTADTVSSCNATQTPVVTSAIADARTWISNVEPRLRAFHAGTAPAGDVTVITNALNHNFHTTAAAHIATITSGITSLKNAFDRFLDVECVSSTWCNDDELAYVRGAFAWMRRLGDVNLCPLFFRCSNSLKRTSTIVHEVSHQHPGATDHAYEHQPAYGSLSPAAAMDNAASYEVFTREVYHNGSYGPGQTC